MQFNYDFDFWGSHGAEISGALDEARAAAAERDSAASMLTAAVADTYFGWQATQVRIGLANEMVQTLSQARSIAVGARSPRCGFARYLQHADSNLATTREQLAMLEGVSQYAARRDRGFARIAPADVETQQRGRCRNVAIAMPADASLDLIARRADIAASRWRVEAALRNADVAHNAFYPDISLSAMVGLSSIDLGKFVAWQHRRSPSARRCICRFSSTGD